MQPQQNTQEGEDNASPNHQWNYGFPPGWMGWSSYGGGGEDQQLVGGPGTWPSLREGIEQQQWVAWQQGMVAAHPGLYSPFASASAGYQISPQPHSSPFVHPQDGLRTSAVPSGDNAGNGWQYYPSAESPAPEPRSGGYQQYLFSQTSPGYADVGQGDDYAYSTWGAGVDPSFQFSMLGDLTPQGTNQAVFSSGRDRGTLAAQRYLPAVLIWEKCINVDIVTSRQGCGQTIRNFLTKCTEKLLPIDKHLPGLGSKDKVILASTLTPFGHPLMQLVIPPPSMRYIHPAVTDASLYCLRVPNTKQTDKKPHFRLSSTGDPGFENSVTADWLVALVGLLYYALPPLRISVSRHYCDEPVCWICELSFVFRCLDVSKQEGRAQPVRIASFAEALFRAGPIMTLGLHEAGPGEVEFRDANSLIVQKDIQESRVTHRIRDSMGLKSATPQWLRHGPEARRPSLQELSVEDISTLASRAQRRRNRVARAVRRNESEKRKARFQEHHRNRLHYRCHQVLNYLLHSFLKLPPQCPNPLLEMTEDLEEFPELHAHKTRSSRPTEKPSKAPGVLFSFKVESITECKQGDSIKLNDQLLLELDHTPWTNIKSVEIDTQESNPISTSSSFLRSNSRPTSSSGVSSVSSVSSLDTHTKLPTLQHAHGPFTRASSSPLMLVDKVPDFCRLLQQSLWKSQAVPMVCSKCESSNTTRHTVRHQVTALPPVLCVKIKLDASPDATPPLRFWRLQFPPSSVSPRTIYTHGLRTGAVTTDDDTDMSRLIAKYTKARSEWLSETDPVAKAEKQFTLHHLASMLDLVCDASASPLPAALYIHKENATRDGNPWSVSTQPPGKGLTVCSCTRHACDKCHRYDLIGVVASINYNWNRARKKLSWLSWTDDLAPRLGIKRKTNCKRSNRVSNLQELRNQVPCLSSAEKERFAQRVEAEEAMIEAPPDEDHLVSHVRCPTRPGDPTKWLFINGPVVAESTEDEARRFGYTWKFPVAFFFRAYRRHMGTFLSRISASATTPSPFWRSPFSQRIHFSSSCLSEAASSFRSTHCEGTRCHQSRRSHGCSGCGTCCVENARQISHQHCTVSCTTGPRETFRL
eukprot:Gregarina_sp_Poly_1__2695@NODE_173_length_12050_cov_429_537511_g154_i0_p1_GENE_NODE_173_length_12050_cov_429_537511_g154_i0NODE_173_length_12050_cov_429_537511_g154_i0_p1_ORF_typecomplete_len1092_score123_79UCH_1/PF13423_6/8_7e20_NODE_173_length_12050_cov_429_537511_g154_i026255900